MELGGLNSLERSWLDIIGPRGIPCDPEQRRAELAAAYAELRPEIERWEALSEIDRELLHRPEEHDEDETDA